MADYPTQLDDIDQWLVDNFGIMPGACSSTENLRYNTAKMIAEALWPKCKESLPKDLDKAAEEYAYNNWQSDDYHIGASEGLPFDAIGHTEACFKAGAEWQKCKDSLHIQETCKENGKTFTDESGELEEEIKRYYSDNFAYIASDQPTLSILTSIARHFVNWQKEQDHDACRQCEKNFDNVFYKGEQHAIKMMEKENKETIELAEDHAMLAGMVKQEEEMREKALEVTVYLDDDGYPCIPEIVLFDFDKNQPTAKEGDTIGVYLFKNR